MLVHKTQFVFKRLFNIISFSCFGVGFLYAQQLCHQPRLSLNPTECAEQVYLLISGSVSEIEAPRLQQTGKVESRLIRESSQINSICLCQWRLHETMRLRGSENGKLRFIIFVRRQIHSRTSREVLSFGWWLEAGVKWRVERFLGMDVCLSGGCIYSFVKHTTIS